MGSLFKSKTKTTKQPFETNPWEPQQEFLEYGFEQGKGQFESALGGLGNYSDTIADLTPQQQQLINSGGNVYGRLTNDGMNMSSFGQSSAQGALAGMHGVGGQIGNTAGQLAGVAAKGGQATASAAGSALNSGMQASNQLNQLAQGNTQANLGGANQVFQGAGQLGQAGQQNSNAVGQQANSLVNGGNIGGVVSDAQQVAANPYLDQQINSAIGDVQRGFQNTQADINSAASGAGGMNSTRAGLLESKALESAQRTAGDISSGMRSDAYNTGLQTSLQNKGLNNSLLNTQLGAVGQGAQIGQNALNTQLAASGQAADIRNTGFGQQLAGSAFGQDAQNNYISQLMGSTGLRMDGLNAAMGGYTNQAGVMQGAGQLGQQMAMDGAGQATSGVQNGFNLASILQQQQQNEIDGGLQQNQAGLDLVSQYMQAIGGNFGQNCYTTQVTQKASPFQQILGGAASIGGMMKGF